MQLQNPFDRHGFERLAKEIDVDRDAILRRLGHARQHQEPGWALARTTHEGGERVVHRMNIALLGSLGRKSSQFALARRESAGRTSGMTVTVRHGGERRLTNTLLRSWR